MTFKIEQIAVGKMANFTYLIIDNEEKEIAVIDPSWDLEKIFERINKNNPNSEIIIVKATPLLGQSSIPN